MVLLVSTGFVALLSEFLVGTIESIRATFGITETFVGIIVVAIIGNAAEHSTAILMALKNKIGSECWNCDRIELADRTLCRAAAAIRLLFAGQADEP
jgi:Ca2+/H+ antiporter